MEVFFDTRSRINSSFSIEVDSKDTFLQMKQKIEQSKGIPVSKQTIFFKGRLLLRDRDHLTLEECDIFHKSRLEFFFPRFYTTNPNVNNQDSTPISFEEFLAIQDRPLTNEQISSFRCYWPVTTTGENVNKDQVFQTEPSNPTGYIIDGEDQPLSTAHFSNIQSFSPGSSNQDLFKTEQSQRINDQDLPVRVGSSNQDLVPSNSVEEVINIPDLPVQRKLIVMVLPYSREKKAQNKILVKVNASDNVEVLRNELVQIQPMLQFDLPQKGYFFVHNDKGELLDDYQSFEWNDVSLGDTIAIFPGIVTRGDPTDTSF